MSPATTRAGTRAAARVDVSALEERLDVLATQVGYLVAEAEEQRAQRERWRELTHDLAPVAREAMDKVVWELEALSTDVTTEDYVRFLRTFAQALPTMQRLLAQLDSMSELASDAITLGRPAMQALTDRLTEYETKGYFDFARSGAGVVDRIVTNFSDDDVRALGDNVVTILETVKEMTQPEVMGMLRRTVHTVQEEEPGPPPSMFAIVKEMRDPGVRRGLARVLHMLRSVGSDAAVRPDTSITRR